MAKKGGFNPNRDARGRFASAPGGGGKKGSKSAGGGKKVASKPITKPTNGVRKSKKAAKPDKEAAPKIRESLFGRLGNAAKRFEGRLVRRIDNAKKTVNRLTKSIAKSGSTKKTASKPTAKRTKPATKKKAYTPPALTSGKPSDPKVVRSLAAKKGAATKKAKKDATRAVNPSKLTRAIDGLTKKIDAKTNDIKAKRKAAAAKGQATKQAKKAAKTSVRKKAYQAPKLTTQEASKTARLELIGKFYGNHARGKAARNVVARRKTRVALSMRNTPKATPKRNRIQAARQQASAKAATARNKRKVAARKAAATRKANKAATAKK